MTEGVKINADLDGVIEDDAEYRCPNCLGNQMVLWAYGGNTCAGCGKDWKPLRIPRGAMAVAVESEEN